MTDAVVEQAILVRQPGREPEVAARSPGFADDWLSSAAALCLDFGEPPPGHGCPASLFAGPLGDRHVAVVQTAECVAGARLAFHLLVVEKKVYEERIGDPFALAASFPPNWSQQGEMPALSWPAQYPPQRTVAEIQEILKRPDGPLLLGSVQALVDGGKLIFERPRPDTDLLAGLWKLLPAANRCTLWPATFAFGTSGTFHAVIVPQYDPADHADYVTEQQAEYYPQGRYELNLQIAAEDGDQFELDRLFARRSRAQTFRLGLWLLAAAIVLAVGSKLLLPRPAGPPKPPPAPAKEPP